MAFIINISWTTCLCRLIIFNQENETNVLNYLLKLFIFSELQNYIIFCFVKQLEQLYFCNNCLKKCVIQTFEKLRWGVAAAHQPPSPWIRHWPVWGEMYMVREVEWRRGAVPGSGRAGNNAVERLVALASELHWPSLNWSSLCLSMGVRKVMLVVERI